MPQKLILYCTSTGLVLADRGREREGERELPCSRDMWPHIRWLDDSQDNAFLPRCKRREASLFSGQFLTEWPLNGCGLWLSMSQSSQKLKAPKIHCKPRRAPQYDTFHPYPNPGFTEDMPCEGFSRATWRVRGRPGLQPQ